MSTEDAHKPSKFCKNRARGQPLRGNYIGKIPFFSVLGAVITPNPEPIKVKFGREEQTNGPLHAKCHLDR